MLVKFFFSVCLVLVCVCSFEWRPAEQLISASDPSSVSGIADVVEEEAGEGRGLV